MGGARTVRAAKSAHCGSVLATRESSLKNQNVRPPISNETSSNGVYDAPSAPVTPRVGAASTSCTRRLWPNAADALTVNGVMIHSAPAVVVTEYWTTPCTAL